MARVSRECVELMRTHRSRCQLRWRYFAILSRASRRACPMAVRTQNHQSVTTIEPRLLLSCIRAICRQNVVTGGTLPLQNWQNRENRLNRQSVDLFTSANMRIPRKTVSMSARPAEHICLSNKGLRRERETGGRRIGWPLFNIARREPGQILCQMPACGRKKVFSHPLVSLTRPQHHVE